MSSGRLLPRLSPLDTPLCLFHAYQCEDTVSYRTLICPWDDIIPLFLSSTLQRGGPTEQFSLSWKRSADSKTIR